MLNQRVIFRGEDITGSIKGFNAVPTTADTATVLLIGKNSVSSRRKDALLRNITIEAILNQKADRALFLARQNNISGDEIIFSSTTGTGKTTITYRIEAMNERTEPPMTKEQGEDALFVVYSIIATEIKSEKI